MSIFREQQILDSWHDNAAPWIKAISNHEISSRITVTNQAIIEAALEVRATHVLDVGCGEGWLARELAAHKVEVVGVDAVPQFIEQARSMNSSPQCSFYELPFDQVNEKNLKPIFNLAICNFSLFGDESVNSLLTNLQKLLTSNSHLLIQTLHPSNFPELESGWQQGSWKGFSSDFVNPAPWFYRTIQDWDLLLSELGYLDIRFLTTTQKGETNPSSLLIKATRS